MKQVAKVKITDIKYKNKIFLLGVEVRTSGYKFHKAYRIMPEHGPIDISVFKENIRQDIIEEIKVRKAIKPIKDLKKDEFIIEYDITNKANNNS
jgi:hypothetical protein